MRGGGSDRLGADEATIGRPDGSGRRHCCGLGDDAARVRAADDMGHDDDPCVDEERTRFAKMPTSRMLDGLHAQLYTHSREVTSLCRTCTGHSCEYATLMRLLVLRFAVRVLLVFRFTFRSFGCRYMRTGILAGMTRAHLRTGATQLWRDDANRERTRGRRGGGAGGLRASSLEACEPNDTNPRSTLRPVYAT